MNNSPLDRLSSDSRLVRYGDPLPLRGGGEATPYYHPHGSITGGETIYLYKDDSFDFLGQLGWKDGKVIPNPSSHLDYKDDNLESYMYQLACKHSKMQLEK